MDNIFNKIDKEKLAGAINSAAKNSGMNADAINSAINSGNAQDVLNSLNPEQAAKLKNLLSDKEALGKILNSPQAALLLRQLIK